MASYPAENYVAANMVVADHVRMAAPEGWHFHSKKKDDPKEILFWISDKGANSTHGVVRMNQLDFTPNLQLIGPKYAELAMTNFIDKEIRETELDGYPTQIVTGRRNDGSAERVSALVSTSSTNLVEITFASSSNQLLANPSVPYSILNSYKLMPGGLSARHIRDSFSFRCDDGHWFWIDDIARTFMKNGFTVGGAVDRSLVLIDVGQVSTNQFRDLFKLEMFDVPEHEVEIHLAGQTFTARSIGRHANDARHTSAKFFFKHKGRDYLLGINWTSKQSEPMDPKSLHEHPAIREALDDYFSFAG